MVRTWSKHKKISLDYARDKNTTRGEQGRTTLKPKVFVAMYTNEGLKFQMLLGPLKFEPLRRGRPKVMV